MPMRTGILAIALLATVGIAAEPMPPAPVPSRASIAATVNDEPIPLERVDTFIREKLAVVPLATSQLKQLRTEIVHDLIGDVLLKQFLTQYGPKIEPAEIDRYLKAFADNLTRRGKTLAEFLKETHQSEAALRETWMILLQLNGYVKQHVTDEQLKQYYTANKDYFDRVEVQVSHIMLRMGATAQPAEKAAAREKLARLRAEIAAGKLDFATAARKYSHCPTSTDGGDLGAIPRKGGPMDEAFNRAAFALKPGEISDIVETEYGLHLIRVSERKPGTPSAFEKCIEDVRDTFAEDFRVELVEKLRKQARIQVTIP